MANYTTTGGAWTPRILSVLRIVAALLFMLHGAQKMFGYPPQAPSPPPCPCPVEQRPQPPQPAWKMTLLSVGGYMEFIGGLLLMLGLFTRPLAFLLSGMMAVAYFGWHFNMGIPGGFWPITNRGEAAALYSFVFLYLAFAGGGPWSLDALVGRRR